MKSYNSIIETIGKTPLMRLNKIEMITSAGANIYGKLEAFNPAGSIKDRVAISMILDAERKGIITPGATIIEPTSGNTGIGLASVAAAKGYNAVFVLPESMSVERRNLLKAYGAEVVLTEASKGMKGSIEKAIELSKTIEGSFIPGQFDNYANVEAHIQTTGPEIWNDLEGKVDIFVAGIGTGGTITGNGVYLKSKNPNIKVVAVEPANSPLITEGRTGSHNLQGIGPNFVPSILQREVIDEVITVMEENAYDMSRKLAREEGYLAGISSGAALWAAVEISKREENKNKNIVVVLPDSGERYLSTVLFSE